MTPSTSSARRKPVQFSTREKAGAGSAPRFSLSGSQPVWTNPSPVIVQRRARTARRARVAHTIVRLSILLVADLLALLVAYDLLRFLGSEHGLSDQLARFLVDMSPRGVFPRLQVPAAALTGLAIFRNYGTGPAWRHGGHLVAGSALGLFLVFWSHIWDGISTASVVGFVFAFATVALSLIAGRIIVDSLVHRFRPTPTAMGRALVIGPRARADSLMLSDTVRRDSRLDIIGFVSTDRAPDPQSLGTIPDLVWLLERHDIDTIVLADHLDDEMLVEVLEVAHQTGCTTLAAAPLYPLGGFVPEVVRRGHIPYVEIRRPRLDDAQLLMKRAFDSVASALLLAALAPVLAAVAIAIRVSSPGPVFFRQKRVGHCGRLFDMYKFRSMVRDAEGRKKELIGLSIYTDERLFKVKNDPRITRVGRFLRRASLDELPQLWNVLRGDMSLVGPRPPLATEVAKYDEPHYRRFDMPPGITGLWQVSGRSNITSFDEIIALDTAYLSNWSLTRDLTILLKTIPAVLSMRGAV